MCMYLHISIIALKYVIQWLLTQSVSGIKHHHCLLTPQDHMNYVCSIKWSNGQLVTIVIKTHDSESRGQEEAGRTRRMSVLFTGSTGVKFVNALNKPPLKLSLSYQGLSTF